MFKHNICGDQPEVLDGMPDSSDPLPPEFFMNPRCPPAPTATEVTTVEVDQGEVIKEPDFCLSFSSLPPFCNWSVGLPEHLCNY